MENMAHKLIQDELDRYQREAEDKTRRFLQHQDEFLSAVATVELLKNHGLRESAEVCA